MNKVRITAIKKVCHYDLIEKYENPIDHACLIEEGDVWISSDAECPEGFCKSAWGSIEMFVFALANGAEDFYGGWMKNRKSAMVSCNDGFRPVSFFLESL